MQPGLLCSSTPWSHEGVMPQNARALTRAQTRISLQSDACTTRMRVHPPPYLFISNTHSPKCLQAEELERRGERDAVRAAAARRPADPRHSKYHLSLLRRAIAAIDGAPSGTAERHARRVAALKRCTAVVGSGGCTAAEPFEIALRLLEVEEETAGAAAGAGVSQFCLTQSKHAHNVL